MYLTQGLHRALQQHPDRTAVMFGAVRRTWAEFGERVARYAAALQALGMQPGDRVAMLAMNSDRYLEYQLGVPWGGGVLNPCNVRWSVPEIVYSLVDSGSTILVVDRHFAAQAEAIRQGAPSIREVLYADDGPAPSGLHDVEALLDGHAAHRRRRPHRRRPARYLLYRRHHRVPERRDAQPRQPVRLRHVAAR